MAEFHFPTFNSASNFLQRRAMSDGGGRRAELFLFTSQLFIKLLTAKSDVGGLKAEFYFSSLIC